MGGMIVAALLDQLQRRADRPVAGNVQAGLFLDQHDEDVRLGVVSGAGTPRRRPISLRELLTLGPALSAHGRSLACHAIFYGGE